DNESSPIRSGLRRLDNTLDPRQGREPEEGLPEQDGAENREQDGGIAHDSDRLSLQDKITNDAASRGGERGERQSSDQGVATRIGEHDARQRERYGSEQGKNPEPVAVEDLLGENCQRMGIGHAFELTVGFIWSMALSEPCQECGRRPDWQSQKRRWPN